MAINRRSRMAKRRGVGDRRQTGVSTGLGEWEVDINLVPLVNRAVSVAVGVVIGTILERPVRALIYDS